MGDKVLKAIRQEIVPSVDGPLVAEEALELYEQPANPPRSPDAYSLAPLNAYLGMTSALSTGVHDSLSW